MQGLIIGRFQPFHLGHDYLIERISEEEGLRILRRLLE